MPWEIKIRTVRKVVSGQVLEFSENVTTLKFNVTLYERSHVGTGEGQLFVVRRQYLGHGHSLVIQLGRR